MPREYFYQDTEKEKLTGTGYLVKDIIDLSKILVKFKGANHPLHNLLKQFEDTVFDDKKNLTPFLDNPKNQPVVTNILLAIKDAFSEFETGVGEGAITGKMPAAAKNKDQALIAQGVERLDKLLELYVSEAGAKLTPELLDELKGTTPSAKESEKKRVIAEIEQRLLRMRDLKYQISSEEDLVSKEYNPIEKQIDSLEGHSPGDPELKELRIKMLKQQYYHRRGAYLELMHVSEERDYGLPTFTPIISVGFQTYCFPILKRHIQELKNLGVPDVKKYQDDYDKLWADYDARRRGHLIRQLQSENLIWGVEGHGTEGKVRMPLNKVKDDGVYLGQDLFNAINGGIMNKDKEFKGQEFTNLILQKDKPVEMLAGTLDGTGTAGTTETQRYDETAFGFCMRMFDRVYLGLEPEAKDGQGNPLTTRNVHQTADKLIKFVHEKLLKEIVKQKKTTGVKTEAAANALLDMNFVERVFYVHSLSTLNHSYLASASSYLQDTMYYMFRWIDYANYKSLKETNDFNTLSTYVLFSFGGNIFEELFGENKIEEIRHELDKRGLLSGNRELAEETGLDGLDILINGSYIVPEDVAQGYMPETRMVPVIDPTGKVTMVKETVLDPVTGKAKMTTKQRVITPTLLPPLRYFNMRDATGKSLRYPPITDPVDGTVRKGRIITFDDIQTVEGERIYELMPFDKIGLGYVHYHYDLAKNGLGILNLALKAKEGDFLSTLDTPHFAKTLRNQSDYSMRMFATVGPEIGDQESWVIIPEEDPADPFNPKTGRIETPVSTIVMNATIIMLIYAKCLMQVDVDRTDRWTIRQVREYLREMARTGALGGGGVGQKVAEGIELVVDLARKMDIRIADFTHRFQEQLEEQAKLH